MTYLGLALVAACVLFAEIALTRFFSFRLWYHYAFMIIGVAMLGLGSGSTAMALARRRLGRIGDHRVLAAAALAFSLALSATVPLLGGLDRLFENRLESLGFVALNWIVLFVPFFFAGCAISWAIQTLVGRVHRAYGFDLAGAAAGALGAALLLDRLWPEQTLGLVAASAALAGLAFLAAGERPSILAGFVTLVAVAAALTVALRGADQTARGITRTKGLHHDLRSGGRIVATYAGANGRVDVVTGALRRFAWGLGPRFAGPFPEQLAVRIDGDALTMITRHDAAAAPWRFTDFMPSTLPYELGSPRRVLLIGPGGGMDVVNALARGAERVTGVEINRRIIQAVRDDFADFAGGVYSDPRVEIVHGDGRNFVEGTDRRFDLVQLTLVDTFAAISSGALALSEDFLYTTEAFRAYVDVLSPDGMLALGRSTAEALPLTVLIENATRGLALDLGRHLFIARHPRHPQGLIFVFKRSPFAPAEIEAGVSFVRRAGLELLYAPGHEGASNRAVLDFLRAPDPAAFVAGWKADIVPETDDRPFYFRSSKWSELLGTYEGGTGNLWTMLALAVVFGAGAIVAPMLAVARAPVGGHGPLLGYFALLGAGFILLEMALMTKLVLFLGHPARSLSVTLFALLLASGAGSAASRWLAGRAAAGREPELPLLRLVVPAIAVVAVVYALALAPALGAGMGLALGARIAIAVAVVAPLGFLLGMPLPLGIRALDRRAPELVLWGWGLNAVATVIGAVGAILLAHAIGFSGVLVAAAACYLAALAAAWPVLARASLPAP